MSASIAPKRRRSGAADRLAALERKALQVAEYMVEFPDKAEKMAPIFDRLQTEMQTAKAATAAAEKAAAYIAKSRGVAAA